MKLLISILLTLVALFVFAPMTASAQGPIPEVQPWMYPCAEQCGFGTIANVQAAFKRYQDGKAAFHQWTTEPQWRLNYDETVSEFLAKHGFATGGINEFTLSPKLKIDVPIAMCDFGVGVCAD